MSPADRDGEFYVGYLPTAPAGLARHVRRVVIALLVLATAAAALVAASQRTWQPGRFELGVEREARGVFRMQPVAHLQVERPGATGSASRWLLVRPGKHGADPAWSVLDGSEVLLRGTFVHRGGGTMLEVVPGSLRRMEVRAGVDPEAGGERLGSVSLRGEIVDSKCWLGVMNPGSFRTHRACATLCVRGGIPPLFVARDAAGAERQLLLVGPEGEAVNAAVLEWIARPVEISGELRRLDELLVLRADPAAILALED